MPTERLELDRRGLPEGEHRRFGVPVFPLEPRERVETLVDLFQTPGRHRHALAEPAHGRQRVLDQRPGAVDRVGGRGERRVEPRELAQETPRAVQPARRRALVLVEQPADLGEPRGQPLGVLESPALGAQLLLLAFPQPGAVELRELKAEEILALRSIALRRPRALDLGPRGAMPGQDVPHPLAQLFGVPEAVQEIELARRLQEALVLVLTVDLDEVVAEPLQEPDRHRRVVDEGAMTSGLRELPAHDELAVVQGRARRRRARPPPGRAARRRTPPRRWRSRYRCG